MPLPQIRADDVSWLELPFRFRASSVVSKHSHVVGWVVGLSSLLLTTDFPLHIISDEAGE